MPDNALDAAVDQTQEAPIMDFAAADAAMQKIEKSRESQASAPAATNPETVVPVEPPKDTEPNAVAIKPIEKKPEQDQKTESQIQAPELQNKQEQPAAKTQVNTAKPSQEEPEIKLPKNASPQSVSAFKAQGEKLAQYKNENAALKEQLAKAQELAKQAVPKEVQAEVEELRKFRAMHALQDDPEFKTKYDKAIETGTDNIYKILKNTGINDEVIEAIKTNGGLFESKDANGVPLLDSDWWQKLLGVLPYTRQRELQTALDKTISLKSERAAALDELGKNREKYYAENQEKEKKAYEQDMTLVQQVVEGVQKKFPWAKLQEIPANATPEQKAAIEADNEFYKQTEERFKLALWPKDMQTRVNTAMMACLAYKLDKTVGELATENDSLIQQNQALQAELAKIQKSSTSPKTSSAPIAKNEMKMPVQAMDLEAGADMAFNKVLAGNR